MSIQAFGWAFSQDIPDPLARLVLLSLANAHNQARGRCFPTIAQIEKETSLSKRTVQRKIDVLIETGFVTMEEDYCPQTGRQRANEYVLNMDDAMRLAAAPRDGNPAPDQAGEGVRVTRGGCQGDTGEGVTGDRGEGVSCGTPLKEPEEIPEEKTLGASAPKEPAAPDRFEELWAIYPKREGANPKKPARAKFERLVKSGVDPERIIAAARRLAARHPSPSPYVPQAVTWLNQERYADEASEADIVVDHETWARRLRWYGKDGRWGETFGPPPGQPGCLAPPELLSANTNQAPHAAAS